ncbi:unnamed protein product [Closterium sp. Naga37s-1]|nr:unnamed protein product [Closterium sp. Naga37s-1]
MASRIPPSLVGSARRANLLKTWRHVIAVRVGRFNEEEQCAMRSPRASLGFSPLRPKPVAKPPSKKPRPRDVMGAAAAVKPRATQSGQATVAAAAFKVTPAKETPAKTTSSKATLAKATPAKVTPTKATPVKVTPTKAAPAKVTQTKAAPAKATPAKVMPPTTKATPAKVTPVKREVHGGTYPFFHPACWVLRERWEERWRNVVSWNGEAWHEGEGHALGSAAESVAAYLPGS